MPANAPPPGALPRREQAIDPLPCLQGRRIRLRGHRDDDFDDFYGLYSDPAVMRYWSFPAWTHPDQARERFAMALAGRDRDRLLCWAIAERATDRLVGGVTLFAIDATQRRAEIGYALASAHWHRGYAGEALRLALGHAFDALGMRRIEADIDPRNIASCRLVQRLGFVREGLLRERWQVGGEACDSALYGLLAGDWRARVAAEAGA